MTWGTQEVTANIKYDQRTDFRFWWHWSSEVNKRTLLQQHQKLYRWMPRRSTCIVGYCTIIRTVRKRPTIVKLNLKTLNSETSSSQFEKPQLQPQNWRHFFGGKINSPYTSATVDKNRLLGRSGAQTLTIQAGHAGRRRMEGSMMRQLDFSSF